MLLQITPPCFPEGVAVHGKEGKLAAQWEARLSYDCRNVLSRKLGPWQTRTLVRSLCLCTAAERSSVARQ